MSSLPPVSVQVIGAGAWGTALALQAARALADQAGATVRLWPRDPARAAAMARERVNPRLPGVVLPASVTIDAAIAPADIVLLAMPMQHLRALAAALPTGLLVACCKGVEAASLRGYKSVICLPLRYGQRTFGMLGLYSSEIHEAVPEERKLLQQLADDLAFGIAGIRARDEQSRTQEAVLAIARPPRHAADRRTIVIGQDRIPFFRARRRVERDYAAVRRRQVHDVADDDRNCLGREQARGARWTHVIDPCLAQAGDIGGRDLSQRREALCAQIAVVARPVADALRPRRSGERERRSRCD